MSAPVPSAKQLFVGNLPFTVQWQDLKDLFREAGTVIRADIATSPNGRSRGFGTVLLSTEEESTNAINTFHNFEWHGRKLEVREDRASTPFNANSNSAGKEDGQRSLYVGNLPYSVGWQDLKDFFRQAGNVQRADIPSDYQGRSKGFGTVVMATAEEALAAIEQLNGQEWNGRQIEVREDKKNFEPHYHHSTPNHQSSSRHQSTPHRHQSATHYSRDDAEDSMRSGPPLVQTESLSGRALFVGNLPFIVQWQELKDLFRQAGNVQRADVVVDGNGRSRGYGQVVMATVEEAQKGIELLHETEVQGRTIEVREDKFADGNAQVAGTQIYVGNLPYSTRWQELKDIFRPYGLSPVYADVISEQGGRSKGFGIVRFATKEDAERAVNEVNGLEVANRNIIVRLDKFSG